MAKRKPRILLTGGGSGGHIYPLLAVAEKITDAELIYVGAAAEYTPLLELNGIPSKSVLSSKLRAYFSPLNLIDLVKLVFGFIQALWHLFWNMPDVVFSKGGPGALPVVLAAKVYFIPIFVHESDTIPGVTNKISGKLAAKIGVAFESAVAAFPKEKVTVTGQPVRNEVIAHGDRARALSRFDLSDKLPVLLVLGGSQGAEAINEFILENIEELLEKYQIIHQTGTAHYENHRREYEFLSKHFSPVIAKRYYVAPYFVENIADAYAAADLVVSRAGAGAIFECAANGIPSVMIPLPNSAHQHQELNAYEYQKAGACIVFEQQNMLTHVFISTIDSLLKNKDRMQEMREAAQAFYNKDSAAAIATLIMSLLK